MESLIKLLRESSKEIGLGDICSAGELVPRWREIVGKQVGDKTRPLRIKNKTLLIRTSSPGWSHQLSLLKPTVITKLKQAGFEINDLRFIFQPEHKIEAECKPGKKPEFAPDFSAVPDNIYSEKLRQAIASYLGATQGQPG